MSPALRSHLGSHFRARRREAGVSLIEIMVGLVIGLIATAVIFQTFAVSEGFKRNTTSAGDAQQNGLFSMFTLALELANAGNGLAISAQDLATCPNTNDWATVMQPIPVFIDVGASDDKPDSFVVNYSVANEIVYPATFLAAAAVNGSYYIQSPIGFKAGDMIVAIGGSQCDRTKITAVTPPDASGGVTITHSGAPHAFVQDDKLFNFGQWDRVQRVEYKVIDSGGGNCIPTSKNCVLRSQNLTPIKPDAPDIAEPIPLASNVVLMKVQYGVDNDAPPADGILDTWVKAEAQWDPASLMALPALPATLRPQTINRIKAIRIGLIVRSAQYDRAITTDFDWVMFDCEDADKTKCQSRLTGSIAADAGGGGYRYRVYETVVPLRNQLWNKQL